MTGSAYDIMLSSYDMSTDEKRLMACREVSQRLVLAGLNMGGFFDEAAFYGGSCLRLFHGLNRYSEDMDFSLIRPNGKFDFSSYFKPIVAMFGMSGRNVEITWKGKVSSNVESAFLKDNTDVHNVSFQWAKSIKIKIEVDTQPPLKFQTEPRFQQQPYSFFARCYTLPDLFADKMHALVYRAWKHRIKGRDWYDFDWYVRNRVPLDFCHLAERVRQFNGTDISKDEFVSLLKDKLATSDISLVKEDVRPFVLDRRELETWSNDYFLMLADMIVYQ